MLPYWTVDKTKMLKQHKFSISIQSIHVFVPRKINSQNIYQEKVT